MSDVMAKTMAEAHVLWQDGKYQQSVEVMQSLGDSDLPPQVTSYYELLGAFHPAAGEQCTWDFAGTA